MIRQIVHHCADRLAFHRLNRLGHITTDKTAKIKYRNLSKNPPLHLSVGAGTIIEGIIIADRPSAVVSIGSNTFIGGSSIICAERIEIGDDVLISWGVTVVDHNSHAISWQHRKDDVANWYHGRKDWDNIKILPVRIGNKAWIGFNAIILPGVEIGEGAIVASGAVVTKNVAPYTIVGGNPANMIREISRDQR